MADDEEKTSIKSFMDLSSRTVQKSAYLLVVSTKSSAVTGRMFKLEKDESILGRSSDAEINLVDDGISRKHAKFVVEKEGYRLVDLGSTNGSFLNGKRVQGTSGLKDGDKIQVGSTTVLLFTLQDQLEEQFQRSMYESATRDGLTRIHNKKYFLDSLRKEFAYCLRHSVPLALVMFDVDHFKKINDGFGHPAGDYVLSRIAQKVNEKVRTEDLFARYGGEEFSLLLRESEAPAALVCAERCRKAVETAEFSFNGTPIRVTISLGVATLQGGYKEPEELIAEADRCLYKAKQGGRNRTEGAGKK